MRTVFTNYTVQPGGYGQPGIPSSPGSVGMPSTSVPLSILAVICTTLSDLLVPDGISWLICSETITPLALGFASNKFNRSSLLK